MSMNEHLFLHSVKKRYKIVSKSRLRKVDFLHSVLQTLTNMTTYHHGLQTIEFRFLSYVLYDLQAFRHSTSQFLHLESIKNVEVRKLVFSRSVVC